VLPTGIATDESTKFFFQDVVDKKSLVSLFDFENKGMFPSVHSSYKFCLFTSRDGKHAGSGDAEFVFFAHSIGDLRDQERKFRLSAEDIFLFNPDTRTCPIFRSRHDAELTKMMYKTTCVLGATLLSGGWGVEYLLKLVDPTIHRNLLLTRAQYSTIGTPETSGDARRRLALPLYEGKHIYQFDHRYSTFDGDDESTLTPPETKLNPTFFVEPRYWLRDEDFRARLSHRPVNYPAFLSVRSITNATNERTMVTAIRPFVPALNSLGNLFCRTEADALFLCGCMNSYPADYIARQKVGGVNLSPFYLLQLAVVPPERADHVGKTCFMPSTPRRWIEDRVFELIYTSWDLEPFAEEAGCYHPPFRWNDERRYLLRCELDAAFFHFYLPISASGDWEQVDGEHEEDHRVQLKRSFAKPRDAVAYIMDTFPITKRRDEEQANGDYRTKRTILEIYDAMAEAIRQGTAYHTRLDPPPAYPTCQHSKKTLGILAFGSLIHDPGTELEQKIVLRIKTKTPFPVEYARFSGKTRGGAPTLVPCQNGSPVSAEILVLDDAVSTEEAADILWRRETRKIGTGETYKEGTTATSVLVREFKDDPCIGTVLYTDFPGAGKISTPLANELAERAIRSVATAQAGMDGISYLRDAIKCGIDTPITEEFRREILRQTNTESLEEALAQQQKQLARSKS
jgi:hypothetical protein